jgi:hypothetical protein
MPSVDGRVVYQELTLPGLTRRTASGAALSRAPATQWINDLPAFFGPLMA